ncbi:hypothetical protein BCR33DRAFT_714442 [Rhizoclosmatium globosum]|uniref:Uncharacterized protein n=1 Tax=Rhizoclosmatium globosum TaxID=329046 RepID=A0A1Y2CNZ2_9FUNG|nr:hypothetical protein BCR33DRAFT_714442 [Rhizoclosmatium globosum]|eukprot:ORY48722.1 hypothetical protein BCR33DRAFT_714442 [Rhizoclosmatium globosum]
MSTTTGGGGIPGSGMMGTQSSSESPPYPWTVPSPVIAATDHVNQVAADLEARQAQLQSHICDTRCQVSATRSEVGDVKMYATLGKRLVTEVASRFFEALEEEEADLEDIDEEELGFWREVCPYYRDYRSPVSDGIGGDEEDKVTDALYSIINTQSSNFPVKFNAPLKYDFTKDTYPPFAMDTIYPFASVTKPDIIPSAKPSFLKPIRKPSNPSSPEKFLLPSALHKTLSMDSTTSSTSTSTGIKKEVKFSESPPLTHSTFPPLPSPPSHLLSVLSTLDQTQTQILIETESTLAEIAAAKRDLESLRTLLQSRQKPLKDVLEGVFRALDDEEMDIMEMEPEEREFWDEICPGQEFSVKGLGMEKAEWITPSPVAVQGMGFGSEFEVDVSARMVAPSAH